ncbi:MAG: hypothetical protein DRO14_00605 [Thermoprotei archaeon]|nr:MAG: hypothetical protein DRO14_00605 [Thermoprotei archaeon]
MIAESITENDMTRGIARPAVIIASLRSGGTFLAHCLSNHPHIFCDRGEPLHYRSVWLDCLDGITRVDLLQALLDQTGYHVSMCKLTYRQAFLDGVWEYLVRAQPAVIHLRRENYLRQAVSFLLNCKARAGHITLPQHTFRAVTMRERVSLAPRSIIRAIEELREQDEFAKTKLAEFSQLLELTYEDIAWSGHGEATGIPWDVSSRICDFLGVPQAMLHCHLRRVNPQPLPEIIENWGAVRAEIERTPYAVWLEEEEA